MGRDPDRDRTAGQAPGTGSPIGMFDSGVGGLTVLHECLVSLPGEDFIYLGDSEFFPYGNRDPVELRERAERIAAELFERRVKLLVIACNSATAAAADGIRRLGERAGVPVITVIEPEAEIAAAITANDRVGVLATPATVASGAYRRALAARKEGLAVTEVAAPDLATIIQYGANFDQQVVDTVREYCRPLAEAGVDTVILGCTHYPLVAPMLQRTLGRDVRLVTAGHAIAAAIQRRLAAAGRLRGAGPEGEYRFLVTGDDEAFTEAGTRFLQLPLAGRVERLRLSGGPGSPERYP